MNNIYPDFHFHTCFSEDCETPLNDLIDTARKRGITTLCFTDHNDLDYPQTHGESFYLDIDKYIPAIAKLREENPDLDIRIGVEQGLMPTTCERLNSYSQEHPGLDFIINSIHVVDGEDPYFPECWVYPDGTPKTADDLYTQYFEDMLYNATHFTDFNVQGHIDYIFRYGPKDDPSFKNVNSDIFANEYFPKYKEIIHEILKTHIENGKGIEINTGALTRGLDFMHPHIEILKMYKDLGGEILTFGSDAHVADQLGYKIKEAMEYAKSIGFKYFTTFKNMKPEFHNL